MAVLALRLPPVPVHPGRHPRDQLQVHVGYDLELVLTNGPARKLRIKDADAHQLAPNENSQEISEINLSATGFTHTFRLLEGIAADGKSWIERHGPDNLTPFQIAG